MLIKYCLAYRFTIYWTDIEIHGNFLFFLFVFLFRVLIAVNLVDWAHRFQSHRKIYIYILKSIISFLIVIFIEFSFFLSFNSFLTKENLFFAWRKTWYLINSCNIWSRWYFFLDVDTARTRTYLGAITRTTHVHVRDEMSPPRYSEIL